MDNNTKTKHTRDHHAWTHEEDEILNFLVKTHKPGHWAEISREMLVTNGMSKTTKQCRSRWVHCLNPELNKSEWTVEEEKKIFDLQRQYGNKWTEISKSFNGRTDNTIKNHWYSTMRKNLRKLYKFIGCEIFKDDELKRRIRFMESMCMNASNIRIVCNCMDYIRLPEMQFGSSDISSCFTSDLSPNMTDIVDSQPSDIRRRHSLYIDFIHIMLQMYQKNKFIFTPYAPDVIREDFDNRNSSSTDDSFQVEYKPINFSPNRTINLTQQITPIYGSLHEKNGTSMHVNTESCSDYALSNHQRMGSVDDNIPTSFYSVNARNHIVQLDNGDMVLVKETYRSM